VNGFVPLPDTIYYSSSESAPELDSSRCRVTGVLLENNEQRRSVYGRVDPRHWRDYSGVIRLQARTDRRRFDSSAARPARVPKAVSSLRQRSSLIREAAKPRVDSWHALPTPQVQLTHVSCDRCGTRCRADRSRRANLPARAAILD
jgi:hypothetical protein